MFILHLEIMKDHLHTRGPSPSGICARLQYLEDSTPTLIEYRSLPPSSSSKIMVVDV
jgi:hypothetical protein